VIPRLPLSPHPCNAFALTPGLPSSWHVTLQPLCLGREPKARVATFAIGMLEMNCMINGLVIQ